MPERALRLFDEMPQQQLKPPEAGDIALVCATFRLTSANSGPVGFHLHSVEKPADISWAAQLFAHDQLLQLRLLSC